MDDYIEGPYEKPNKWIVWVIVVVLSILAFLALVYLIPTHATVIYPDTAAPKEVGEPVIITAYSCEGYMSRVERLRNCPFGLTKLGTIPDPYRTIACDPARLGEWILIEGIGYRRCEDTGRAIKGNRIDLYVANIELAKEWGRKKYEAIHATHSPLDPTE